MQTISQETPKCNIDPLTINLDVAHSFIKILAHDGGGSTFQTFDDAGQDRPGLTRIIHARQKDMCEALQELKSLNDKGAGIFVTVNRTDGRGRSSKNIVALRSLFVDGDDVPMPARFHATPDLMCWRSETRWHAYWLLDPKTPLETFTPAQKKLAAFYGTDSAIHDLPRVMRVPGFIHRKAEPCEIFMEAH